MILDHRATDRVLSLQLVANAHATIKKSHSTAQSWNLLFSQILRVFLLVHTFKAGSGIYSQDDFAGPMPGNNRWDAPLERHLHMLEGLR